MHASCMSLNMRAHAARKSSDMQKDAFDQTFAAAQVHGGQITNHSYCVLMQIDRQN